MMSADSRNSHDSPHPGPRRATRPSREHVLLFGTGAGLLLLAGAAIYVSSALVPQADGYPAATPAMHGGDTAPLDPLLRPLLLSPLARRAEAPDFRLPRVDGETADEVRPVAAELGLAFPLLVDRTRAGQ